MELSLQYSVQTCFHPLGCNESSARSIDGARFHFGFGNAIGTLMLLRVILLPYTGIRMSDTSRATGVHS